MSTNAVIGRERRRLHNRLSASLHPDLSALFFFLALVLVAGRPVLAQLDTVIAGDDIDVYVNPWADWWTLKALRDPALTLWHSDYLFYPGGADLTYHSFSHLNTALSLLLRPLVGVLPAYNLTILFNYLLIALSMYQLARYWTGSATAGLVAGVVFAFNSHSLYQSCHPVLLSIWTLPWTALFLLKAMDEDNVKHAVVAGLFVFLAAAVSMLMLILLAIWMGALTLYMLLARKWRPSQWPKLGVFLLVGAGLSLPLHFPLLKAALLGQNRSFTVDPMNSLVTDLASFFTPLWIRWYIRGIYVGILPGLLLLPALWRRQGVGFWVVLALVTLLFAAGPRPFFAGQSLDLTLPWSVWPAMLLRNMYRLNIILSLALAMLAAYGWLALSPHLPQGRSLRLGLTLLLCSLIFADYLSAGFPHTDLSVPRFYSQELATMPEDVVVAIVPTGRQPDKVHAYYQTIHGHKTVNGVVSRPSTGTQAFIEGNALLRAGLLDRRPLPPPSDSRPALRELRRAGVDLLIVEKGWRDVDVEAWRSVLPGAPVYEDGRLLVYAIEERAQPIGDHP